MKTRSGKPSPVTLKRLSAFHMVTFTRSGRRLANKLCMNLDEPHSLHFEGTTPTKEYVITDSGGRRFCFKTQEDIPSFEYS